MLPGIRILFATFVLSASVLIFGLGAAALLRSAHEEFVGIPAWRAAQQPMVPAIDTGRPSLALLRVEPPAPEKKQIVKPEAPKTVSIDAPAITDAKQIAGEKTAAEENKKSDEVRKPRVRRAKRARNIRQARSATTIRHWSARTQQTVQPQQPVTNSNSPFAGFDAADQTASSGAGSNRRTAARSPF